MHKLLSVDDEPINQAIIEELFADKFDVALVSSGKECIQNIENIKPDLILLDVSMEGMDGYETCRRLKQMTATRDIPVIFVSARGSFEDKVKAYEAGGQDYIIKPFSHSALEETIEQTIIAVQSLPIESQQKKGIYEYSNSMATYHFEEKSTPIITFLSACCVCASVDNLGEIFLNLCQEIGLDCILQLRLLTKSFNFSKQTNISSLEQSLLEYSGNINQFFNFNSKTIITFPHVSILIKNTPIKSNQHNVLKHLFGLITQAIEARIKSLNNKDAVSQQYEQFLKIIKSNLSEFEHYSRTIDEKRQAIIQAYLNRIEQNITSFRQDESQTELLKSITRDFLLESNALSESRQSLEEKIQIIENAMQKTTIL